MGEKPHRVLFVCLGNICRSPAAEGVFQHLVEQKGLSGRYVIDSAGTSGSHRGEAADARMQKHAEARGYKLTSRSRRFTEEDFEKFDLILVMDQRNFEDVEALDYHDEFRHKIKYLTSFCQTVKASEVPDPYYGGSAGFERVLDIVEDASVGVLNYFEGLPQNTN